MPIGSRNCWTFCDVYFGRKKTQDAQKFDILFTHSNLYSFVSSCLRVSILRLVSLCFDKIFSHEATKARRHEDLEKGMKLREGVKKLRASLRDSVLRSFQSKGFFEVTDFLEASNDAGQTHCDR